MLEYIAIAMIVLGGYLLITGLREGAEERYAQLPEKHMWAEAGPEYAEKYGNEGLASTEDERKVEVRGGGVVLIGPIPIVFGDSKYAVYALILSIVLMLLAIAFMVRV